MRVAWGGKLKRTTVFRIKQMERLNEYLWVKVIINGTDPFFLDLHHRCNG